MVSRLQVKATQIGRILSNLERSYDATPMASPSTQQPPPMKKPHLRIDPIPPFNANKIRKSPTVHQNSTNAVQSRSDEPETAVAAKEDLVAVAEAV